MATQLQIDLPAPKARITAQARWVQNTGWVVSFMLGSEKLTEYTPDLPYNTNLLRGHLVDALRKAGWKATAQRTLKAENWSASYEFDIERA